MLLHKSEAKLRMSVNNKDILQVYYDITGFYPTCFTEILCCSHLQTHVKYFKPVQLTFEIIYSDLHSACTSLKWNHTSLSCLKFLFGFNYHILPVFPLMYGFSGIEFHLYTCVMTEIVRISWYITISNNQVLHLLNYC